jgi:Na+/H+ antiporter NhaA
VLWINDGLMAIFFFLIGLEIKREVLEGELSSFSQVVLPGAGALGGMVVPAAIYGWFNWDILFRRSFYHSALYWYWRDTHCCCDESA